MVDDYFDCTKVRALNLFSRLTKMAVVAPVTVNRSFRAFIANTNTDGLTSGDDS